MIIDFHTHSFPEKIAEKALNKLSASSNMPHYLNGTVSALQDSMKEAGVDYSILLPVCTGGAQQESINRAAVLINDARQETGVMSFGGIHPENDNYREILTDLARHGIKGIKLHPVFQDTYIDDIRYLRIIDCASELGLITLAHAGYDISFPGITYASPKHIRSMIDQVHPKNLVLAHMGGWGCWDEVEEFLADCPVWLDTCFTLTRPEHFDGRRNFTEEEEQLTKEQFQRLVSLFGADHILFGSDSPWTRQSDSIRALQESGLDETQLHQIFSENAVKLLGL